MPARILIKRLVAASMRDIKGIFLYIIDEIIMLILKIDNAAALGIKIKIVAPSLWSPQGSWLKIGINGGRFV
jgi:hypothetical protein